MVKQCRPCEAVLKVREIGIPAVLVLLAAKGHASHRHDELVCNFLQALQYADYNLTVVISYTKKIRNMRIFFVVSHFTLYVFYFALSKSA